MKVDGVSRIFQRLQEEVESAMTCSSVPGVMAVDAFFFGIPPDLKNSE